MLSLAFMGTPNFSVPALTALLTTKHKIVAVYTRPPRPAGRRGLISTPSPVQKAAQNAGLTIFTPQTLYSRDQYVLFKELSLDAVIVIAYGMILPKEILMTPKLGCFNIHASLLPRWRGAAPLARAIMAGDQESGVTFMKMDEDLDTGFIALEKRVSVTQNMTAGALHNLLSHKAAELVVKAIEDLEQGKLSFCPQREEDVTYAKKIKKRETRVDWNRSAKMVHRQICALSPFPGAWCEMKIGGKCERVKLLESCLASDKIYHPPKSIILSNVGKLEVSCAEGTIFLTRLQRAGGKELSVQDFMHGAAITAIH